MEKTLTHDEALDVLEGEAMLQKAINLLTPGRMTLTLGLIDGCETAQELLQVKHKIESRLTTASKQ